MSLTVLARLSGSQSIPSEGLQEHELRLTRRAGAVVKLQEKDGIFEIPKGLEGARFLIQCSEHGRIPTTGQIVVICSLKGRRIKPNHRPKSINQPNYSVADFCVPDGVSTITCDTSGIARIHKHRLLVGGGKAYIDTYELWGGTAPNELPGELGRYRVALEHALAKARNGGKKPFIR